MAVRASTICVLLVAVLAGCGSDSSTTASIEGKPDRTPRAVEHRRTEKPKIEVPQGPPPQGLATRDLIEGDGVAVKRGDEVTVQYVATNYQTKKQFDSSWDEGWESFTFKIGEPKLIAGWSKGVEGMRVGGRRELIIPPKLGYGDRGEGQFIPPGATLILMVDLLSVK